MKLDDYLREIEAQANAEIERLRVKLADYESGNLPTWKDEYETMQSVCNSLEDKLAKTEAKLAKATQALRFYADTSNWFSSGSYKENQYISDLDANCIKGYFYGGKRARQTLTEIEGNDE